MLLLLLPVAVIAAGLLYQRIGAARDRARYPPPGRLIKVGGTKLHVRKEGQGKPVVVLESGIGASSLSWAVVQSRIASFTTTISYDRAGLGWSEPCRATRSVPAMVNELRSLLSQANELPPYIFVGHSFGGLLVRAYASLYPQEVAGLVLVDPVSAVAWANCSVSELRRLHLGVKLARRGVWAARLGLVRGALAALLAGGRWFPKLAARVGGRRGSAAVTNLVGEVQKLPSEVWPLVRSHWSDPRCFSALAAYLQCLPEAAKYALGMHQPQAIPTIILSASTASQNQLEERAGWVKESSSRQIRVADSGHWLHLEKPDVVIEAIRELTDKTRESGRVKT